MNENDKKILNSNNLENSKNLNTHRTFTAKKTATSGTPTSISKGFQGSAERSMSGSQRFVKSSGVFGDKSTKPNNFNGRPSFKNGGTSTTKFSGFKSEVFPNRYSGSESSVVSETAEDIKKNQQSVIDILSTLDVPSVDDLFNAGLLFGEKKSKTNPKMMSYIYQDESFDSPDSVINVEQTQKNLKSACEFLFQGVSKGHQVLFVGTKESSKEIITRTAEKLGMPFVANKWSPGLLTNFSTVLMRLKQQKTIEETIAGTNGRYKTKKEKIILTRKLNKLNNMYAGIKAMQALPNILFVIDGNKEKNAIKEAIQLNIPVIGLLDTDCNPEGIKFVIPGNDDSRNSVNIVLQTIEKYLIEALKCYSNQKRRVVSPMGKTWWTDMKHGNTPKREFIPRASGNTSTLNKSNESSIPQNIEKNITNQ